MSNLQASAGTAGDAGFSVLARVMNIDLIANKQGQVWVTHDQPIPGLLQWAEYDIEMGSLVFVAEDGAMHDTGMKIQDGIGRYLRAALTMDVMLVQDGKVESFRRLPIVKRAADSY